MKFSYFFYILILSFTIIACKDTLTEDNPPLLGFEGLACNEDKTCEKEDLVCIDDICVKDKCIDVECSSIALECNKETGICDTLKEGFCSVDAHCDNPETEFCNQETYKCEAKCNENELRCSSDGTKIEKCNSRNTWLTDSNCSSDEICNSDFICKDKCTSHDDCKSKELCNSIGQCINPICSSDSDCNEISSVNTNEVLYCDVLATPKACLVFNEHSCGGESSNDMTSKAEEIDIINLSATVDVIKNGLICIDDQEWYKINLTEDVNSLNFKLEFAKGDLDLIIIDSEFNTIGYSMAGSNTSVGGEENINSRFLAKGVYYIHIYRYQTADDTDSTENSDYKFTISNLDTDSKCTTAGKECLNLEVLRSTCEETTGACKRTQINGTAELGELCEEKSNCNEDASYGCFDMEIQGTELDNYCAKTCVSDDDCLDINAVCQSFIVTKVCIKPCNNDDECKLLLDDDGVVCNAGKCE